MKDEKRSYKKNSEFGLVAGLTVAAVVAAGFYFLYGKKGAEKNRKLMKDWLAKAKREVLEKIEELGKISKNEFEDLIDDVVEAYEDLKGVTKTDLNSFKSEMLEHWSLLEKTKKNKNEKRLKSQKSKTKTVTKKSKGAVKRKTKVTKSKTDNKKTKEGHDKTSK